MPEGDTLYRVANQLRAVLAGETVCDAASWARPMVPAIDAASLVGRRVETVEAVGKHLLVTFDDRRVLHSHLGMYGSWHVYAHGAEWRKPARRAALKLSTTDRVVVNFSPDQLELVSAQALRGDAYLRRLGPDVMLAATDVALVLPRLRAHDAASIGEAVMNQTLLAGVGNVYKSETLFLARIDPWRPVGDLGDDALLEYLTLTQQLMRKNRRGGVRRTRFEPTGPRLWVYGRRGEACLRCGGEIRMRRQGEHARSTYWCPGCQSSAPA